MFDKDLCKSELLVATLCMYSVNVSSYIDRLLVSWELFM